MKITTLSFLPPKTMRAIEELTEELELRDPRIFVRKAVEDKLREFERGVFFSISDRVANGLRRKGIRPAQLLRTCKS